MLLFALTPGANDDSLSTQQRTTPLSEVVGAHRSLSNISTCSSSKQRTLPSRLSQGIGNHHQLIFTCAWTTPQRWPISTRGGGHTLAIPVSDSAGSLVSCAQDRILGDSGTYSRYTQCRCRHSFSSIQPQGGMDIGSQHISKDSVSVVSSGGRSLCVPAIPPGGEVCFQISRSSSNSSRCLSPRLEEVEEFHSPPCEPSFSGSKEDPGRKGISSGGGTELAQHALVPTISTDVGGLPLHLPAYRYLLYLPFDLQAHHPLWATLNLTVWPVSGDVSRQQAFRQTLSRSSCLHGVSPQRRDMLALGGLGLNGVPCVGGAPFQHL